uniref:ORF3 n=1 Tax=Torque teno Leptonychotes weddellii virus-2 TaxID=2012677 RepID=A0A1Z2RVX8_9VIRU|nr:ORF3 [Torque teno Leptonychotes weddellii virus-2]
MDSHTSNPDRSGLNINFSLSSLETLSTEDHRPKATRTWFPEHQNIKTKSLAHKYRLAPYSKGPSQPQIYSRETSTQTEYSKMQALKELLALVEEDSQPCWCQKGSDLELTDDSDSIESIDSLDGSWENEEGGRPPPYPPTGSTKSSPYPSQFLF